MNSILGAPFRAISNLIQIGNGNFVRQNMFDEKWKMVERIDRTLHDKGGLKEMVTRIDQKLKDDEGIK